MPVSAGQRVVYRSRGAWREGSKVADNTEPGGLDGFVRNARKIRTVALLFRNAMLAAEP